MISDWVNGLLVEKADSEALANGIMTIIEDEVKFANMQKQAKKIFNERYTSKVYAENIEKIYESLVK